MYKGVGGWEGGGVGGRGGWEAGGGLNPPTGPFAVAMCPRSALVIGPDKTDEP